MSQQPPRSPLVLLGLLTFATFGGPLIFGLILRGGQRASWPPDRPIEWVVLVLAVGVTGTLFVTTIAVSLLQQRLQAPPSPRGTEKARPPGDSQDP
ncbi:MAG TPA: hypothetical protein VGZ22_21830 [Isosphaeraceae bacterium]|jgi:hypothetical protein|nr:hypothetical protein [Isosphaeraceae bacterium]